MKNTQVLAALHSPTLRELIGRANREGIAREDIAGVLRENEAFILLYYKSAEERP